MITLDGLVVADPTEAWVAAGFDVDADGVCQVGGVRIRLVGRERGTGIVGWSLGGLPDNAASDVDGVPTEYSGPGPATSTVHPNGVSTIDHVVLLSPDVDRTVASFAALGTSPRRERVGDLGGQPVRQVFFRLGAVILEVVGSPDAGSDGPSTLWGITYVVEDIDTTAAYYGERTTAVKAAVQPGRRITTLRHRELGMSVRTALISGAQ